MVSDKKEVFFGEVIWFQNVFGFLQWEKDGIPQKDMFVHFSDIVSEGYRTLFKGQKVSFSIGANKDGNPKAIEVLVLKH